jgi:hypothetical protein
MSAETTWLDRAVMGADKKATRFLSLGAGVQSSTLALMIAKGEVPMVEAAIFADTQWEPAAVYNWLDWLETQLPFPVHRVTAGSIREGIKGKAGLSSGHFASVPWHLQHPNGERGMGQRQCTKTYKIEPLIKARRQLLGYAPRKRIPIGSCETLIGISTDEATRMRDSQERWNRNIYPLIDLRMSRTDCLNWMARHGYPAPPKSSCIGCPFHSDHEWRRIRDTDPEAWADAVALDEVIRHPGRGMRGQQFMHRKLLPLAQVDLSTDEEKGQVNMFENECEGMCGV